MTVTEVRTPDGYIGDPTPKTAIVHPTYTRITRVMEHTITITTTTTTTSVIDIDTGEVLSESSASADAETELDPPTIQEYTDFIEGDRETVVTFVNQIRAAELVIFKYRTGTNVPLAGAQFEVSYVDPAVHSGRWTVTTGADGKATIALPKPGAVLIHEVNPPAGHIISPISGPDTTVTIYAGERKQIDIPNDPYTSITVTKIDSVTGEKLAGAEIRLKHITSGMEFKQTTGADGVALFEQVEPGSYYVEEIKAPDKYVLNTTRYPVQLRSGETASVTITNDPYTAISVVKIDSVTGEPLAGATISLKHVTSGMELRLVTGADGIALFEQIEPGSYYVEEIKAPDRYVINTTRFPVELKSGEVASVTIPDDPYTGIEITKIDANNGMKLAGAYIRLKHIASGQEYSGMTGEDGIIYFGKIPPGDYFVEEVQAPHGYVLNTTRYPLELKTGELATLTIADFRKDGLYIRKVDQDGQPLAGAVFELRRGSGEVLLRETTDDNGLIFREYLTTDTYVIQEIQAPEGYLLDPNNPQSIFIDEQDDNKEYVVTFVNKKKPSIEVIKVDEGDPTKRLQGAVFRISEQGGSKTWDITTGYDGTAILENLEVGTTYLVEEITAPAGYANAGYREPIVLNECRIHTVTVENGKNPTLEIEKIDEQTGDKLPGAVFRVALRGGADYGEYTTGFDGKAIVENLAPGFFVVTETRAPSGYVLDSTPREIELIGGEMATLTVNNSRDPVLTIKKIDAGSGDALPGAVFRIEKQGGGEHTDVTTGADGTAELALSPGFYVVTETRAPSGYVLDSTPREIEIIPGEDAAITVNNSRDPSLTLRKIDEQTLEGIEGVTLRITKDGAAEYQDVTTGPDGTITLPLSPGWYFVQERVAKPGYSLDDTVHSIELKPGEDSELVITNRRKPSLKIIKVCSVTGNPLKATFEVKVQNGRSLGTFTTDPETGELLIEDLEYTSDPLILEITETIAPDGYIPTTEPMVVSIGWGESKVIEWPNTPENPILIYKRDVDGNPIGEVEFLITTVNGAHAATVKTDRTSGVAVVPGLAPGWYTVKETRVGGEEYMLDSTPKQVELKPGDPAVVEFINDRYPALQILKLNKADHQPLPGVLVRVSYMDGEKIGDFRTDEQGIITLTADPGWVTVVEQETLQGFVLDATPVNVELKPNETATVELYNVPLPGLQIRKSDSVTGNPLAGVEYKLTRLDGSVIGNYTTDEQGVIYLDLDEPSVIITEIKTVDGYRLDDQPRTIELVPGELTVVSWENTPFPVLEIVKLDSQSKEPLAGVSFKIFSADMRELGTFPTNSAGRIILTGMDEGKYFVQEVDASAAGPYILDKTVYAVELFYGKTTTIELFNTKMGTLRVRKIDAETGEPLAGAVYLLYDVQGNTLGEYTTDSYGLIELDSSMEPQKIKLKEISAPEGFVLDPTVHEVEIKAGETAEITLENEPERGKIQITKKASDANPITKDKAGAALEGAEFEVVDENHDVVDTITTDERGVGESGDLPLGRYALRETTAPEFYLLDERVFYAGATRS